MGTLALVGLRRGVTGGVNERIDSVLDVVDGCFRLGHLDRGGLLGLGDG